MMKYYAVQGCTPSLSSGTGLVNITTPPSSKVKFDGKGIYMGTITVSISGYTNGIITGGIGTGTISGSSENTSFGSNLVRENDESGQITVTGTLANGNKGEATVTVKIADAGQKKVQGE